MPLLVLFRSQQSERIQTGAFAAGSSKSVVEGLLFRDEIDIITRHARDPSSTTYPHSKVRIKVIDDVFPDIKIELYCWVCAWA